MPPEEEKKTSNSSYIKKALSLASEYFLHSDERFSAWLLFISALISIAATVGLTLALSWWSIGFWAAIETKNLVLLVANIKTFGLILISYVSINAFKNYVVETLTIQWQNWLAQSLLKKYLYGKNNYLDLMRQADQIDNPEQRIQEDVKSFAEKTITLTLELFNSVLTLVTFISTLWVIGGTLSFAVLGLNISIPGYLVWVALGFALTTSIATHLIGASVSEFTHKQEQLEADFRKEMQTVNNDAESIAQDEGELYYARSLANKLGAINNNSSAALQVKTQVNALQDFSNAISTILPFLACAPIYFMGRIELSQLYPISTSFGSVNTALGLFVNYYEVLATYETNVTRIIQLEEALEGNLISTKKAIIIKQSNTAEISVKQLDIAYPSNDEYIMRGLNLTFKKGEHTLINAASGLGKSTLFKVIAGSWQYGTGEVTIPGNKKICFLPQKPVLPLNTLKAVLAYPDSENTYTNEQYIAVLRAIGNMEQFISELEVKANWSKRLSSGQQQRISFARALLKKPEWLFLDEATASLDEAGEEHLYDLARQQLTDTTLISIAHRPAVAKFHQRQISFFATEKDQPTGIKEQATQFQI